MTWADVQHRWSARVFAFLLLALVVVAPNLLDIATRPRVRRDGTRVYERASSCSLRAINASAVLLDPHLCWCSCTAANDAAMRNFNGREKVVCPDGTLERHRFTCFLFQTRPLDTVNRILYIAPHDGSLKFLKRVFTQAEVVSGYKRVKGSYVPSGKHVEIDVTQIPF